MKSIPALITFFIVIQMSLIVQAQNFQKIEEIIQTDPILDGAMVGISVRSGTTGEVLYEHASSKRLRPASNMKLFTAAAALSILGEEHTFTTKLYTNGKKRWKVLHGNVYIKGNGDPTLTKADLDQFAVQLKEKGISLISGDLIADDSHFDQVRYPVDIPWSDEEAGYGAQISALTMAPNQNFDTGTIEIEIAPSNKIGQPAVIKTNPVSDYVTILNKATTVKEGDSEDLFITRHHGTNIIEVNGLIPQESQPYQQLIGVWEPTGYVLDVLNHALKEQGITVLGDLRLGKVPDEATELLYHHSMPLSELIIPFMKYSNNAHAETLVKQLGFVESDEGSWDKGLEALTTEIKQWNVDTDKMMIRDGSGISHITSIPASQITQLLYSIQSEPWFASFEQSLPLVGGSSRLERGTLYSRMQDVTAENIRAKTGTLTSVSSLAGYMKNAECESLIFSILLNQVLDSKQAKEIEDRIVQALYDT